MRDLVVRRSWLLFILAFFLLIGRQPERRFRLESVSAAAPVANNDTYDAVVGVNLVIPAPGILGNDTDPDGDSLTVDLISINGVPPNLNASLYPAPDGSFQYISSDRGTDVYTYQVTDGTSNSNTATITFHVDAAPVAHNDNYTTTINTPLTIAAPAGVLSNDTDADSDPLSVVSPTQPTNGTVVVNSDGSFTYTPNTDFGGSDSFTYKANDGKVNSNVATVTIKVNRPPVAVDDSYSIALNGSVTVAPLGNDSDPDVDAMTVSIVSQPAHGSLSPNPDLQTFVYSADNGFAGIDTFTYRANDGLLESNLATVSIQVGSPPIANDDSYITPVNTTLNVGGSGILSNDVDPEQNFMLAILVYTTTHGTLTLNADGSFTYSPHIDFTGIDQFAYKVNNGYFNSGAATVLLYVGDPSPTGAAPERNYFTALPIILSWGRVSGAMGYEIQVSTNRTFTGTPVVNITNLSPDTFSVSLSSLANGHYYWRVRTKNNGTIPDEWSTVESFTVAQ